MKAYKVKKQVGSDRGPFPWKAWLGGLTLLVICGGAWFVFFHGSIPKKNPLDTPEMKQAQESLDGKMSGGNGEPAVEINSKEMSYVVTKILQSSPEGRVVEKADVDIREENINVALQVKFGQVSVPVVFNGGLEVNDEGKLVFLMKEMTISGRPVSKKLFDRIAHETEGLVDISEATGSGARMHNVKLRNNGISID